MGVLRPYSIVKPRNRIYNMTRAYMVIRAEMRGPAPAEFANSLDGGNQDSFIAAKAAASVSCACGSDMAKPMLLAMSRRMRASIVPQQM